MKVTSAPPVPLSHYEVLDHFIAQRKETMALQTAYENAQLRETARLRKEYALRKERDQAPDTSRLPEESEETRRVEDQAMRRGASEEVLWMQSMVIGYLGRSFNSTLRHSPGGIKHALHNIAADGVMTKGEMLQLINNPPAEPSHVHIIVDDMDERIAPETPEAFVAKHLDLFRNSLHPTIPPHLQEYYSAPGRGEGDGEGEEDGAAFLGAGGVLSAQDEAEEEALRAAAQDEYVHGNKWGEQHGDAVDDVMDEEQ